MKKMTRQICFVLMAAILIGMLPATTAHAAETSSVTCVIDAANTEKVTVTIQTSAGVAAGDGMLYLFAVPTYVDSVSGQSPVASVPYTGAGTYSFSVNLGQGTVNSLLYSKFYVGVNSGGDYTAITGGNFITNPEVLATSQAARTKTASKKGSHVTLSILSDLEELGIKHAFFGISFADFISNSPTDISYTYNGKTYYFTNVVKDYDSQISKMSRAGIVLTIALVNEYMPGYEYLLYPGVSQREGTVYYAFNTSTQQGLETLAAATHFLAERYNGKNEEYGKVDNWIVGNEVNDNLMYHYMGETDGDTYVREYLQSFRVMYNAIKSAYSNANVYLCLQHRWDTEDSTGDYGGKGFIDRFSAYAAAQGDIDWGLSYHPYSFPINDPDLLNDDQPSLDQNGNPTYGVEVTNEITTPIITMKNLHVLTNYFHNSNLLNPNGEVRSIILGEQGYTSFSNIHGKNEAKQAASVVLGYYMAEMNPDVDAFLLRGHCDEDEGSQYFRFGLRNITQEGKPADAKFAYEIYKYVDTAESLKYSEVAKAALNIENWSDVVSGWNAKVFSSMGTRREEKLYTVSDATVSTVHVAGMNGQWKPGYNVYDITSNDYTGKFYADGLAVANSFAYYMDYQVIEKHFDAPVRLSGNYLTMDVNFKPMDTTGNADRLEVQIRLISGDDVYDATGIVDVNKDYTLCLDLGDWTGKTAVDAIKVLVREYGQQKSFAGTFTVYRVASGSAVTGMTALDNPAEEKIDLSGAELVHQKNFNYSGSAKKPEVTVKLNGEKLVQHQDFDVIYHNNVEDGEAKVVVVGIGAYTGHAESTFTIQGGYPTVYNGVDYSPVYAYGYYKENNPQAVAEVGDDPQALLKHFVTKGMDYALQGIGDFNVLAYAKMNSDLKPELGDDWSAYYMHYLEHGIAEGRSVNGIKPDDMEAPVYPHEVHVPVVDPAIAAACMTTGLTEGSHCSICGEVIIPQKSVPATGHDYQEPTYLDTTCDVCGDVREIDLNRPTVNMFRLYNPNTGEHFYTGSKTERTNLVNAGWIYEGVGFTFPANTGDPVHRLFEPETGEHLYTMDEAEMQALMAAGWNYEGIAFNSGYDTEVAQYRLHNPNATCGAYHFTASAEERQVLLNAGWEDQGIGWYSCWK